MVYCEVASRWIQSQMMVGIVFQSLQRSPLAEGCVHSGGSHRRSSAKLVVEVGTYLLRGLTYGEPN